MLRALPRLFCAALLALAPAACGGDGRAPGGVEPVAGVPRTWVFAAGVSAYEDGKFSLKYADKDAEAVAGFFMSAEGGRVPADRVTKLLNAQAKRAEILSALEEIAQRSADDDMIVIFLSMHATGVPGEPFYFLAHDTNPRKLLGTGISEEELKRAVAKARAKRVVMLLDTCHAGSFGFSDLSGKRALRAEETGRLLKSLAAISERGTGVLAAAGQNEYSEEDPRWGGGHGVFTYHVLGGLQGGADDNGDGVITLRELYDYVYPRVKKDRGGEQHPNIMGNDKLPLVRVASGAPPVTPPVPRPVEASGKGCPAGMAFIPGGEFWMGSLESEADGDWNERPRRRVRLDAYCMDRTEVTVASFKQCASVTQNGARCGPAQATVASSGVTADSFRDQFCTGDKPDKSDHPINCVDWTQADTYCKWAGGRLPTEAEWERAARGGDERNYPWGNERPDKTRLNGCGKEYYDMMVKLGRKPNWFFMYPANDGYGATAPVGRFPASPYGLLDMAGNVWEWTADWYDHYEAASGVVVNPKGPDKPHQMRAVRGGSWGDVDPSRVRAASRTGEAVPNRNELVGFRCAAGPIP